MFFTFDNKRPKENGDDSYVSDLRLRSELRQISEPGSGGVYCHALPRQTSLIRDQRLFESGFVLSNAGEKAKNQNKQQISSREKFNRHTIHYHRAFSTPINKISLQDSFIAKTTLNHSTSFGNTTKKM